MTGLEGRFQLTNQQMKPDVGQLDRAVVERTVIKIVSRISGYREDKIGSITDLVADLGVLGAVAPIEVLIEVAKIYPIDFSGVNLDQHFGPEGIRPSDMLFLLLIYFGILSRDGFWESHHQKYWAAACSLVILSIQ